MLKSLLEVIQEIPFTKNVKVELNGFSVDEITISVPFNEIHVLMEDGRDSWFNKESARDLLFTVSPVLVGIREAIDALNNNKHITCENKHYFLDKQTNEIVERATNIALKQIPSKWLTDKIFIIQE